MAKRPIFIPLYQEENFVKIEEIEFTWFPGLSISQKQKSIESLHNEAMLKKYCYSPLEVSSKSTLELGVKLSAFNLGADNNKNQRFTVETYFQSSKVFRSHLDSIEENGPYRDLLFGESINAKKDPRILNAGELIKFVTPKGEEWPLEPKTAFYDWVYLNTLKVNSYLFDYIEKFDAFTDIEFNPSKSWNCQAYSVALFKSLKHRLLLDYALSSKSNFLEVVSKGLTKNHCVAHQNRLFF